MKWTALCSGAPSDHSDVARKRGRRGRKEGTGLWRRSLERSEEEGIKVSAEVFLISPIGEVITSSHALHFTVCRALSLSQSQGMVVIVYT